ASHDSLISIGINPSRAYIWRDTRNSSCPPRLGWPRAKRREPVGRLAIQIAHVDAIRIVRRRRAVLAGGDVVAAEVLDLPPYHEIEPLVRLDVEITERLVD